MVVLVVPQVFHEHVDAGEEQWQGQRCVRLKEGARRRWHLVVWMRVVVACGGVAGGLVGGLLRDGVGWWWQGWRVSERRRRLLRWRAAAWGCGLRRRVRVAMGW